MQEMYRRLSSLDFLRCIAFVVAYNFKTIIGRIVCATALGEQRQKRLHPPAGTCSL